MNNNNEKNLLKWIQNDTDDIVDKNFKSYYNYIRHIQEAGGKTEYVK